MFTDWFEELPENDTITIVHFYQPDSSSTKLKILLKEWLNIKKELRPYVSFFEWKDHGEGGRHLYVAFELTSLNMHQNVFSFINYMYIDTSAKCMLVSVRQTGQTISKFQNKPNKQT